MKLLKLLPPEMAHAVGKAAMKRQWLAPGYYDSPVNIFGVWVANMLGIAAGFDKNAELIDHVGPYGFGLVEVGSVTRGGSRGNNKPRLFRIDNDHLVNRMGLNGLPCEQVVENIINSKAHNYCAVNVAKTNDPDIMGDAAIDDMTLCYDKVKQYGVYTAINVSCPNTSDGKTFERPEALTELLASLEECGKGRPLLVKLSPTHSVDSLDKILGVCEDSRLVDGFIVSNTYPSDDPKGGLSGPKLKNINLKSISYIRSKVNKVVIGAGGIRTGQDLIDYESAGATLAQVYTGFVHGPSSGPNFAHHVLDEYIAIRRSAGASVGGVVRNADAVQTGSS